MVELFELYRAQIIYTCIVIFAVIVLHIFTNVFHKWLLKKEAKKFPGEDPKPVHLVKRILNTLWILLGIIALSFLFVDRDKDALLIQNFNLILYLGLLAAFTITSGASVNMWFKQSIKNKMAENEDPTSFKFLRYVAVFSIYFVGILFGLLVFPSLRGVAQTALGGAGVIAIIAGVASQEALANLVGGMFIITFKPFKIGDIIEVTDTMVGVVADITLRHTVIRNFDNKMIVIPNSIINKEKLINYSLGESKCCERLEIGISLDSDIDLAKKIMREECENHPLILDNRTPTQKKSNNPIVRTAITKINEYSVSVRVWAWARNYGDLFDLKVDVIESIKKRFDKEGIEIPFPYRTIVMKESKKPFIDTES